MYVVHILSIVTMPNFNNLTIDLINCCNCYNKKSLPRSKMLNRGYENNVGFDHETLNFKSFIRLTDLSIYQFDLLSFIKRNTLIYSKYE